MSDTTITATVIKDSLNVNYGSRLTTLAIRFPRCILPQVLTHRAFSRNTSSSRAIPTSKLLSRDPWIPSKVGINKPGMSAEEYLEGEQLASFQNDIFCLHEAMVDEIEELANTYNIHKQTLNRYLEPWLMTTMLVSSTEWDNFFNLRLHHTTQPEMQELAQGMKEALDASTPEEMYPGDWHVPYGTPACKEASVARCARVSYETHEGIRDIEADFRLYDRLKADGHLSPFEHIACARDEKGFYIYPEANFKGWTQYRTIVEGSK